MLQRAHADDAVQGFPGGTADDSDGFVLRPTVRLRSDPTREY